MSTSMRPLNGWRPAISTRGCPRYRTPITSPGRPGKEPIAPNWRPFESYQSSSGSSHLHKLLNPLRVSLNSPQAPAEVSYRRLRRTTEARPTSEFPSYSRLEPLSHGDDRARRDGEWSPLPIESRTTPRPTNADSSQSASRNSSQLQQARKVVPSSYRPEPVKGYRRRLQRRLAAISGQPAPPRQRFSKSRRTSPARCRG